MLVFCSMVFGISESKRARLYQRDMFSFLKIKHQLHKTLAQTAHSIRSYSDLDCEVLSVLHQVRVCVRVRVLYQNV